MHILSSRRHRSHAPEACVLSHRILARKQVWHVFSKGARRPPSCLRLSMSIVWLRGTEQEWTALCTLYVR